MEEQLWDQLMQMLSQESAFVSPPHCVGCWYEAYQTPFPDQDSSSLCVKHAASIRQARRHTPTTLVSAPGEVWT